MNISVRVLSAQAQAQIKALQAQVRGLEGQLARANATSASPTGIAGVRGRKSLMAFGNQIQWTGRQLQYNWTLPLLLAGGAATKFALDNDKAMTRVAKVYGDTAAAAEFFNKQAGKAADDQYGQAKAAQVHKNELEALEKAFVALSNRYGVEQKQVLETAGAWAAAGVEGVALARSTELSLKAASLGEMELGKATESLIAIQSQYSLSTKELSLTLAELNSIENATGISMQGLIEGFSRSAGVAREAGVDVRHLGAMLAALVPATGSATTAGNALKTIISRLMSPTGDAAKVMREFGVNTADAAWQSSTAVERLTILAGHMGDKLKKSADGGYELSDSQKQVVASVLGSRYQMNRFLVLMREMDSEQGYYAKALKVTKDETQVFKQAQEELDAVLNSSPKRLEIMWRTLQNGAATAIQPLIPYIIWLASEVAELVNSFNNLNPELQKLIILSALLLAAVGPIVRYMGSLATLVGAIAVPFKSLAAAYASFATVSKVVDGVNIKTRRSFLGMFATLLAAPFRPFAIAAGAAFGFVSTSATKMVGKVVAAGIRMASTWGAIIATMARITASGGLVSAFKWLWMTLLAMAGVGAAPVVKVFRGMWLGTVAVFQLGSTASLAALGTMSKTSTAVVAYTSATHISIWSRMWARIVAIWAAARTRLLAILATLMNPAAVVRGLQAMIVAVGSVVTAIIPILLSPWVLAFAAIGSLIYAFRGQIAQVWNNIVTYFSDSSNAMTQAVISAWNSLPAGVTNALIAVVRVVREAALQVYEWFSYINPFARHSPSLVENVTNGMAIVGQQFGNAANVIKGHVKGAYRDIKTFGSAVRNLLGGAESFEAAQQRAKIKEFAPGALKSYDQLAKRLKQLKGDLAQLQAQMDRQQAVVDRWTAKVESANAALDKQQEKLDKLTATQQKWQDKLAEAEDRLSNFANAPITGMGAMSDKIFENEMAQKRLRLEMMRMEETGDSLDKVKNRIEAINAAQESLRGEQAAMRSAGAGSDILSYYDDQVAALEATKRQQDGTAQSIAKLNDELEKLQRQGEMLDLENSLKFDPLTRQIEQAANAMEELPFGTIMAGVKQSAADIEYYTRKLGEATAAVAAQQAVVDQLTAKRDAAQERLDREEEKLKQIKSRYDEVADAISAVEKTMSDAAQAADTLARKADEAAKKAKKGREGAVSPAVQNFRDAAGGNFANVGGAGIPMRTDFSDQSGEIDAFTKDLESRLAGAMGDISPFGGIKKRWGKFKAWMSERWAELSAGASDMFSHAFDGVSDGGVGAKFSAIVQKVKDAWAVLPAWLEDNIYKPAVLIWSFFWPSIKEFFQNAWKGIKDMFGEITPALERLGGEFKKLGPALKGAWNIVKAVAAVFGVLAAIIIKLAINILAKTVRPIFKALGDVIENIIQIVQGLVQVFLGFFSMFSGEEGAFTNGLKKMGEGIYNIFGGLLGAIGQLIKGAFKVVVGFFWGIIDGIVDAALWMYDVMVGHSIIPDLIKAIISWFGKLISLVRWVWSNVVSPIVNVFKQMFSLVVAGLALWWSGVQTAWSALKTAGTWFWNNVLLPIWSHVQWVWTRIVAGLKLWWSWTKAAWSGLKGAGKWIWDNVLVHVFNFYKILWDRIVSSLRQWWTWTKAAWNGLKAAGGWVWDNVLRPVFQRYVNLWTSVRGALSGWWEGIKGVWSSLTKLGGWVKDRVMDPVVDKIKSAWRSIRDWLIDNKSILARPIEGIVNVVRKAVNAIINGLNKVSKILPGKGWHIAPIPALELAQGGPIPQRRVGNGFKTNGARAIVGEGKANHPEFVIPTDPTYRSRAKSLLAMAGSKLGVDIPQYAAGGWLGDRIKGLKSLGDKFKGVAKNAASKIVDPLLDRAQAKVDKVGWEPIKWPPTYGISKIRDWVGTADAQINAAKKKYSTPKGGDVSVDLPNNPGGHGTFRGGTFSNKFIAHLRKAEQLAGQQIRVYQGGFRPATDYSGTSHAGDALDAQPAASIIRALRRVGIAAGDRTGLGDWVPHTHAVPGPDSGYAGGSAKWQWQDYMARGGMNQALTSSWGLKQGGIALKSRGPMLATIGDGRYDEAVVPLPKGWRNGLIGPSQGDKTININGNLEFPNIKSGDDAKTFLDNLESLAED